MWGQNVELFISNDVQTPDHTSTRSTTNAHWLVSDIGRNWCLLHLRRWKISSKISARWATKLSETSLLYHYPCSKI